MRGVSGGELCPSCKELGMHRWTGSATARACQECEFVEERPEKVKPAEPTGTNTFSAVCDCGHTITTKKLRGACRKCGKRFAFSWPSNN